MKKLPPLSEKWRHARTSVEIAWTNEQKEWFEMVVASYGCNKKLDKIKNQKKANISPSYQWGAIKNRYKNAAREPKTTITKEIFCSNTVFSYIFKIHADF